LANEVNNCAALDVGQLVKDEYFTLFESIGAIEVCLLDVEHGRYADLP
jgi:hypothetical protein